MNLNEVMKHCRTDVDLLSATGSSIDSFKLQSLRNVLAFLAEGNAISCNSGQEARDQMEAEEHPAAPNFLILTREVLI